MAQKMWGLLALLSHRNHRWFMLAVDLSLLYQPLFEKKVRQSQDWMYVRWWSVNSPFAIKRLKNCLSLIIISTNTIVASNWQNSSLVSFFVYKRFSFIQLLMLFIVPRIFLCPKCQKRQKKKKIYRKLFYVKRGYHPKLRQLTRTL